MQAVSPRCSGQTSQLAAPLAHRRSTFPGSAPVCLAAGHRISDPIEPRISRSAPAYNSEQLPGRNAMSERPSEIVRNNVKEKLARDEVVASMTVRLVRSVEIARIAKTAGFDSIYVDVEHSAFSLDATSQICMTALEVGITPFVRVPSNGPEYISRVLD